MPPPTTRQLLFRLQARLAPYLFLLPFVVIFCVFLLYPMYRSVVLSLYKSAGPRTRIFVGMENYKFFLRDRLFWIATANTAAFTLAFVILQIPLSLGLALLLNSRRVRGRNALRFAFFSTHLVGNVFVAVIFFLLLAQRHGLPAQALSGIKLLGQRLGLPALAVSWIKPSWMEIDYLGDPILARLSVVAAALWLSVGWGMVFFLAALQGVDRQLYEAANVDGAGRWATFRHVTLPGIRPVLIFLILIGTIGGFQLFELPYVLFNGPGPGWAGLTIVMYLYQNGFEMGDLGAASAIGWLLVCFILLIALLQLKFSGAAREDRA